MIRFLTALVVMLAATSTAAGAELLVLEKGSDTLAIIDPGTLRIAARIPAGTDPHEVVASSDGTRAYISNYGGEGGALNFISVVDLRTRRPLPRIDLGALHSAHGLDFQGGKLYFTAETNKVIGRYDPATQTIDWVMGTGQDRTHMIIVAKDLEHIFTSNVTSGTISILRTEMRGLGPPPSSASGSMPPPRTLRRVWAVTNVPSGRGSEGFDVSPDGRQIWAANAEDGSITVIDIATLKPLETFPVAIQNANRLRFTLDGKYVLVTGLGAFGKQQGSGGNNLVVLDATSHQPLQSFDLGGGSAGILMEPNGERAFVAVNQGSSVAVIDLHSWRVAARIATNQPDGMAWSEGSQGLAGARR